jgi:F-type H+-transporting ATPase subunit gamma
MPGIRDLKNRIKSNQSTRKITRAMQMVSAAKMRKAQNAVMASRTYASLAWELILGLSDKIQTNNPLLASYPNATKVGVVLLGTNRGLVGGLNNNLGTKLKELAVVSPFMGSTEARAADESANYNTEIISEVVVYGKKAKALAQRLNKNILADFDKLDKTITTEDIYPLAQYITDAYKTGEYKSIVIVYNHFVSTLSQKPTVKQLLPFIPAESSSASVIIADEEPSESNVNDSSDTLEMIQEDNETESSSTEEIDSPYIFEPTPKQVLEHLVPRIIESQLYQTILESDASEHSARMVMMKNATEAAGDLIADLTLTFNQLRQNKITTELAEITAGRIALE